jgi:hypothetical protein
MERIGISGIQWVRGHDERDMPDTYPSGLYRGTSYRILRLPL